MADARDVFIDLMDTTRKLAVRSAVAITGGDPLLHPNFREILELATSACDDVSVLGNPETLVSHSKSIVRWLQEARISSWQLSLDGLETTHDDFRYRGSYGNTLKAISILRKANIPVSVLSTVSIDNIDEIDNLMHVVYSLGVSSWDFSRWVPLNGHCGIPPKMYRDFLMNVLATHHQYELKGAPPLAKEPLIFAVKGNEHVVPNSIVSGCGLGSSSLALLPDKRLMACRRLPNSVVGRWSRANGLLNTVLFSPKMEMYRKIERYGFCSECNYAPRCRGCRAAAYAETGSYGGADPQCWRCSQ